MEKWVLGLALAIDGDLSGVSPSHIRKKWVLGLALAILRKKWVLGLALAIKSVSWQFVRFLTRQVRCDLWIIEIWPVVQQTCTASFQIWIWAICGKKTKFETEQTAWRKSKHEEKTVKLSKHEKSVKIVIIQHRLDTTAGPSTTFQTYIQGWH